MAVTKNSKRRKEYQPHKSTVSEVARPLKVPQKVSHDQQFDYDDYFTGSRVSPFSLVRSHSCVSDDLPENIDLDSQCNPERTKPMVLFRANSVQQTSGETRDIVGETRDRVDDTRERNRPAFTSRNTTRVSFPGDENNEDNNNNNNDELPPEVQDIINNNNHDVNNYNVVNTRNNEHNNENNNDTANDVTIEIDMHLYHMLEQGGLVLNRQESRLSNHQRAANTSVVKLIRESCDATLHFVSFQRRLGTNLHNKFCGKYNVNANVCMFSHVLYGMVQCMFGVFALINDPPAQHIGIYMTVGSVFNCLFFPILLMEWSQRIGGCLEEGKKFDTGCCWPLLFVLRLLYCIAGTVLLFHLHPNLMADITDPTLTHHHVFIISFFVYVVCDWALLVLAIILPVTCLCCVFAIANACNTCCTGETKSKVDISPSGTPVRRMSISDDSEISGGPAGDVHLAALSSIYNTDEIT